MDYIFRLAHQALELRQKGVALTIRRCGYPEERNEVKHVH
jgi:hypothetical protein